MSVRNRFLLLSLLAASIPATALQVTFPIGDSADTTMAKVAVIRPRSLKERFDRFNVGYSGDYYRYGTYGDRSRAFRPDETFFINNLSIHTSERLDNGLDYDGKIVLRSVTDPTLRGGLRDDDKDRADVHITSFYSTLGRKDVWEVRVGDLFPNLSRYSFNRFGKGAQANYFRTMGPVRVKTTAVAARIERAREGRNLRRIAFGAATTLESLRLIRGRRQWMMGYRYAATSDVMSSVDNPRTGTGTAFADLQQTVHSLEYGAQFKHGWSVEGENAWSDGSIDRRTDRDRAGYAWRTDVAWLRTATAPRQGWMRLAPFALQFNWELADPYFRSPVGVSSRDQKRWGGRTAHRFNDNFDWTMSFLRLEDNVRNQLSFTTPSRTTNVTANLRPFRLFGDADNWTDKLPQSVRDIRARVEFRYNDRDATNGSVNSKTEDYIYQLLYTNWGANFTADYQFQITDDDRSPLSDRRLQAFGLRVTRPFHYKKWNIRFFPSVGYRVSRDHYRLTGNSTDLQTTNLGLTATWEELSGNFTYTIQDSNREPRGNDFLQNRFNGSITYKPYLFPSFSSVLTYGYMDQNEETGSRSYRQTETRLTVAYTF